MLTNLPTMLLGTLSIKYIVRAYNIIMHSRTKLYENPFWDKEKSDTKRKAIIQAY